MGDDGDRACPTRLPSASSQVTTALVVPLIHVKVVSPPAVQVIESVGLAALTGAPTSRLGILLFVQLLASQEELQLRRPLIASQRTQNHRRLRSIRFCSTTTCSRSYGREA